MPLAGGWSRRALLLSVLSVVVGLLALFGAIWSGVSAWTVYASGGVATATVVRQAGDQRHRSYQVTFTVSDGTTRTGWMDSPGGGDEPRPGDQLTIRYDRAHPGNLYPASGFLSTTILETLFILVIAVSLLLLPLGIRAVMAEPAPDDSAEPDPHRNLSARRRRQRRRRNRRMVSRAGRANPPHR